MRVAARGVPRRDLDSHAHDHDPLDVIDDGKRCPQVLPSPPIFPYGREPPSTCNGRRYTMNSFKSKYRILARCPSPSRLVGVQVDASTIHHSSLDPLEVNAIAAVTRRKRYVPRLGDESTDDSR